MPVDPWLVEVLRCPDCGERVRPAEGPGVTCTGCGRKFVENEGILVMLPSSQDLGKPE